MMEASATKQKSYTQAVPMSELLPGLFVPGPRLQNAIQSLSTKKKPRHMEVNFAAPTPSVLNLSFKPMPMAELTASYLRPRPKMEPPPSGKKTGWNSSVKVDQKKISHTANNKMKNNSIRKTLFRPQPRLTSAPKITITSETPKFPKPEFKAKKSLYQSTTQASQASRAKSSVRISGIYNIPQTPAETTKPVRQLSRMTIANKENNSYHANTIKKPLPPPPAPTNLNVNSIADTPMSKSFWNNGSSDASFLQKEKEIQEIEEKVEALLEEPMQENIADISPPISTPFKDYRSVQEYFNNSSMVENSALYDDTIMCFDKPSISSDNRTADESVIVKLCNLFDKVTTVGNTKPEAKADMELDNMLKLKSLTENMITNLKTEIKRLNNSKEQFIKYAKELDELIEKTKSTNEKDKTLVEEINKQVKGNEAAIQGNEASEVKSPIISQPCSVIKSRLKISKKNPCLREKITCKSMPNICSDTPVMNMEGEALNMYMKLKQEMKFLSTPIVNRTVHEPNTPAVVSRNLQKQLDKLYNEN